MSKVSRNEARIVGPARFAPWVRCLYLTNPQANGAGIMVQNTQTVIDAMIANPSPGHVDWWWSDALFMAPPVVARLGAVTSQGKYYQFLDTMWSDATSSLFDATRGLFWRDSTFVQTTTYWSRGNGWVMGGIARVLDYLPTTDAGRASYVTLLQTMAAAVAPLQGTDGLWRSDLLHPATYPNPETSGTSLFCYAMAWGIHHGVLDRATGQDLVHGQLADAYRVTCSRTRSDRLLVTPVEQLPCGGLPECGTLASTQSMRVRRTLVTGMAPMSTRSFFLMSP